MPVEDAQRLVCGNVYPYTVTDDRFGSNKKRKDNGKRIFPDEIVLGNLVIITKREVACMPKTDTAHSSWYSFFGILALPGPLSTLLATPLRMESNHVRTVRTA